VIREICETGILVGERGNGEIVLGIGSSRGLRPQRSHYLDVDSGARVDARACPMLCFSALRHPKIHA
jgi:hypothetical protein